MGAVRRAEGVVHEDITVGGEPRREGWVILLFTNMEADVLQQEELSWSESIYRIIGPHAERVACGWNHQLQVVCQTLRRRSQPQTVNHLPVWATEMRGEHNRGSVLKERLDRWDRGANARVVHHLAVRERHVEIDAQEDALATRIKFADRALPRCGLKRRCDAAWPDPLWSWPWDEAHRWARRLCCRARL